jgi:AcrR family transcriptional regulator
MIVEAAFRAIAKDGFEGLRTREVARLVGINVATLHHHFATKENLIAAVANHLQSYFRVKHRQAAEDGSAAEAMERQLKDAIFYRRRRPEMLAVYREFVGRASRDPIIRKLVRQLHEGWHADVLETLKKGQKDGSFRADLDLKAAASVILSTVWSLVAHIFPSLNDFDAGFHELTKWIVTGPKGQ